MTSVREDQRDQGYRADGGADPGDGLAQHLQAAQHVGSQPEVSVRGGCMTAVSLVRHVGTSLPAIPAPPGLPHILGTTASDV